MITFSELRFYLEEITVVPFYRTEKTKAEGDVPLTALFS